MLQMTGIDFIKQIKEKYSSSINNFKTKFMLVTAFMKSNFDLYNALNYINIDKIIEKPIRLEIFKEVQKLMKQPFNLQLKNKKKKFKLY